MKMLSKIWKFMVEVVEDMQRIRMQQAEEYLAKSIDHADLERRQQELSRKGVL
jgi:hypothetical protein